MRGFWKLGVLLPVGAFVGCGGGGSGDGNNAPPPPPPTQSAAGVWNGSISQGSVVINDASCVVTEAEEIACLLFDPANGNFAGAAHGSLQVTDGDQVSGSGRSYAAPGYVLADGSSVVANFSIGSGTIDERDTLQVEITSLGETGTFSGTFDPIYDRGSSLGTIAASYAAFDVYGDPASFSIDANGAVYSQTASGCVGNGQISIIDPDFNAYAVEVTVSNCPGLNGGYEGLAITTDFATTNDVFLFGIFKNNVAILGAPLK